MARYKFYQSGGKTICVSTFAKKPVRGVAKCSPNDTYDEEKGMRLAQLRCDVKIAQKRVDRANKMEDEAWMNYRRAEFWYDKMDNYVEDAIIKRDEAQKLLEDFERSC
ncbi:MAG: hypothetical protein IJA72_01740 [Clostridia bacterium]|nr:hypothetical protein [Clostridia bacterium]